MASERRYHGIEAAAFTVAAAGPVSLDDLVESGTARPTELWRWLEAARVSGDLADAPGCDPGWFVLTDPARQAEIVTAAERADWRWLLERARLIGSVLANARRAAETRQAATASALFAGVVQNVAPGSLPGGEAAWVELVVECVRRFRFLTWLDDDVLQRAISAAVGLGNRPAQAVLWGASGFAAAKARRPADARDHLEQALETARSLNDPAISFEVHVQAAYGQVLDGDPQAAVATFERFLGDIPDEILPLPPELVPPFDPMPEIAIAVLGNTYGQIGQHGRGLDLLYRLRAAGTRAGRAELVALADSLLCGFHAGRRDAAAAGRHAESAFNYWTEHRTLPYFLWSASIALAWARMMEGRLAEAPAILEIGQRCRLESGLHYFAGSALFEVLDRLDLEGLQAPPGLDIETEIDRVLGWTDRYMPAVAHRIRARRLARGPMDEARVADVSDHLARSVEILRASKASAVEFARALDDASRWKERLGQTEQAARLAAEAHALFVSVDLAPATEPARQVDVAAAFLELGRLDARATPPAGMWGELTARLCATVGAERCALFDRTDSGVRLLAARGGRSWCAAVEATIAARQPGEPIGLEPEAADDGTASPGQLLIVTFTVARPAQRGWVAFENRYCRALVTLADRRLLDLLAVQLGILTENLTIWKELLAARERLEQENRYYRQSAPAPATGGRIVGDSPALRETLDLAARVARATTTVLIQGETGAGKDLVAREIHRLSSRAAGPFMAVHIASLAPGLVASSLFGHERGAFTGATEQTRGRFELADGGTLFLDEVGELGPDDQVRLLRVLQEGTFERVGGSRSLRSDFRLIAATNRDLAVEVREGRFREDLFYRLAAFPITVPPLRDRREEIPTLALYFLDAINRKLAVRFEGISEADMARLVAYRWPGNVRELEHLIERAALLSEPPRLRIPPLQDAIRPEASGEEITGTLEDAERRYIRAIIEQTGGRIAGPRGAAARAGLKASTLNWQIERLGLRSELQRVRAARC
ncbi:MAG: sigma-54 dependent transcriptional regulator [Vicinamibacterales bacterium]